MLAKDQHPVDISMTGTTLLNNVFCVFPVIALAHWKGELNDVPFALMELPLQKWVYILGSCTVGVGIGYCGIWAQSLISATSFLVLVNLNKFAIIFIEGVLLQTKELSMMQAVGAILALSAGVFYGKAKDLKQNEVNMQTVLPMKGDRKSGQEDVPTCSIGHKA